MARNEGLASLPPSLPLAVQTLPCVAVPDLGSRTFEPDKPRCIPPSSPFSLGTAPQAFNQRKQAFADVCANSQEAQGSHAQFFSELRRTFPEKHIQKSQPASFGTCQTHGKAMVHSRLSGARVCSSTTEIPVIVDEKDSYWVVQKPLRWPSQEGLKVGAAGAAAEHSEMFSSQSLAAFIRDLRPEEKFPVLSSAQHNYGVVLDLKEPWSGFTVVAKTEAAYVMFEEILELQLLDCYLECFVRGPPLHTVNKLYGRTAIGRARLCAQVLQSTVCRTGGGGATHTFQKTGSPPGSAGDVVSHTKFRISFPPVFLPDILWCNGLTITGDPYIFSGGEKGNAEHNGLCCFAISIPSFAAKAGGPQEGHCGVLEESREERCKDARHLIEFPLGPAFPSQMAFSQFLYGSVLCAGLLAALPIAWHQLAKIAKWVGNSEIHLPFNSIEPSAAALRNCIKRLCTVWGLLVEGSAPLSMTGFANHEEPQAGPSNVEVLFGQAEGAPWLQLTH